MGLSWHGAIEWKQQIEGWDDRWHTFADLIRWDGASDLASVMNGGRDREFEGYTTLFPARGKPTDSRSQLADFGGNFHDESWLTLEEMRRGYESYLEVQIQNRRSSREAGFEAVMAAMARLEAGPDHLITRFVFVCEG